MNWIEALIALILIIVIAFAFGGCATPTSNDMLYSLTPDRCDAEYCNIGRKPWQ